MWRSRCLRATLWSGSCKRTLRPTGQFSRSVSTVDKFRGFQRVDYAKFCGYVVFALVAVSTTGGIAFAEISKKPDMNYHDRNTYLAAMIVRAREILSEELGISPELFPKVQIVHPYFDESVYYRVRALATPRNAQAIQDLVRKLNFSEIKQGDNPFHTEYTCPSGRLIVKSVPLDNAQPLHQVTDFEISFWPNILVQVSDLDIYSEFYENIARNDHLVHKFQKIPAALPEDKANSKTVKKLEEIGAKVYLPENLASTSWDTLAGYEDAKRQIEDTLLLALKHPSIFHKITHLTRKNKPKTPAQPRAILFNGPPGCGKTTSARIISSVTDIPMVYLPIEAIMSKFYGESENNLGQVFKLCTELGTCLIFFDEIDSLATSRSNEVHEATRKVLSVLLREMDGFEQKNQKSIIIAATNRKDDLDAALLSRFNLSINFDLPSADTRESIFELYANQLTQAERRELAGLTHGFSGRDIESLCEVVERRIAGDMIRGQVNIEDVKAPTFEQYVSAVPGFAQKF